MTHADLRLFPIAAKNNPVREAIRQFCSRCSRSDCFGCVFEVYQYRGPRPGRDEGEDRRNTTTNTITGTTVAAITGGEGTCIIPTLKEKTAWVP